MGFVRRIKKKIVELLLKDVEIEELVVKKLRVGNTVKIDANTITLPGLTADPPLAAGKIWYRSDIGRLSYSPDGVAVRRVSPLPMSVDIGDMATAFEISPYIDVSACVLETFVTYLGATILNSPNLSASKAAAIINDANIAYGRVADIFNNVNLSNARARDIIDAWIVNTALQEQGRNSVVTIKNIARKIKAEQEEI